MSDDRSTADAFDDPFDSAAGPAPRGERSWWSRNWTWAAPLGCLTPVLLCGGVIFAIVGILVGTFKTSTPYQASLAAAQEQRRGAG